MWSDPLLKPPYDLKNPALRLILFESKNAQRAVMTEEKKTKQKKKTFISAVYTSSACFCLCKCFHLEAFDILKATLKDATCVLFQVPVTHVVQNGADI